MIQLFFKRLLNRSLLIKCLGISVAIHIVGIYIWIKHPILVKQYFPFLFSTKEAPLQEVDSRMAFITDTALEDFFKDFFPATASAEDSSILKQNLLPSLQATKTETISDPIIQITAHSPLAIDQPLPSDPIELFSITPTQSPDLEYVASSIHPFLPLSAQEKNILHSFPTLDFGAPPALENDTLNLALIYFPTTQKDSPSTFGSYLQTAPTPLLEEKYSFITQEAPSTLFALPHVSEKNLETSSFAPTLSTKDPSALLSSASLSSIDDYLSTQILYNMQWNDSFSVTPSFFTDEEGYVFSLAVSPKEALSSQVVKQNVYFLIDVSSEIENHKINVFKRSVLKALSSLQSGDYFNIFLLDKKIISFSPNSVPFSFQNLRLAEEFLEKKRERAFFTSFDLFQSLASTLDQIESSEEMHTAILLSNGKFSSSYLRKHMGNFLEKNQGKISLFSAGVGKNNDLVHLDMISSLAGGKLLYSDTNASFPRKLSSFVKGLHGPLAKDIHLCVRTNDPKAEVVLLPRSSQPSHLYSKEPFIIMGKTNRLCPLEITLEGKNEEGWILIQKEASFSVAEEASMQMKKEWALRQVSSYYEKFLQDGEEEHLQEAKKLLKIMHGRTLGE
jgi:hypothetical protein